MSSPSNASPEDAPPAPAAHPALPTWTNPFEGPPPNRSKKTERVSTETIASWLDDAPEPAGPRYYQHAYPYAAATDARPEALPQTVAPTPKAAPPVAPLQPIPSTAPPRTLYVSPSFAQATPALAPPSAPPLPPHPTRPAPQPTPSPQALLAPTRPPIHPSQVRRQRPDTAPTVRKRFKWWVAGSILAAVLVAGIVFVVVYLAMLTPSLPELRTSAQARVGHSSYVYAADGQELTRFFNENRTWVSYDAISQTTIDALIATEDHRFFEHSGVDVVRLFGSAWRTMQGERQGASTITMQLVRNLYPEDIGRAVTIDRKVKEMMTAMKLEQRHGKQAIIEMYLNTVAFGYNAFGIEAAAQTFFGVSASNLNAPQAATLIGMLKATTRYNPVQRPERALERRNVALAKMHEHGYLSDTAYQDARMSPLGLQFSTPSKISDLAPHFAEHVREWAEDWATQRGLDLYSAGLKIYTTLDPNLQQLAQTSVDQQMQALQAVVDYEWGRSSPSVLSRNLAPYVRVLGTERNQPFRYFWQRYPNVLRDHVKRTPEYRAYRSQGLSETVALTRIYSQQPALVDSVKVSLSRLDAGMVSIDPLTGHVKAWVGGRDFTADQFDKVAQAKRQPGSTFKPFVYAAALEAGYSPYQYFQDSVQTFYINGARWRPTNSGGSSGRYVMMRTGLAKSINTVTAKLMDEVGVYDVVNLAKTMGIQSDLSYVPSIALGTVEVSVLEMVSAYGTISTGGTRRKPVFVTRIEDRNGVVLETFDGNPEQVLSEQNAYTLIDMMRGAVDNGTARRLHSEYGLQRLDLAGKTGTTQNSADGWFMLMHPKLVTGAWVGFNDQRITFRSSYWGQGGHNALHLVGDYYANLLDDPSVTLSDMRYEKPVGYVEPRRHAAPVVPRADSTMYYNPDTGYWEVERGQYDRIRRASSVDDGSGIRYDYDANMPAQRPNLDRPIIQPAPPADTTRSQRRVIIW
ncbi:MAG: hypothetical protein RhofKO_42420 [Rhodothermales bacterium]